MRRVCVMAASATLLFLAISQPAQAKPPNCNGAAEDCSETYDLPRIPTPPTVRCDDSHPCMVLVNLSPGVVLTGIGIQVGEKGGKPLWLNLFKGEYQLPPFKATKWTKGDDLPCKLTFRLRIHYQGKSIDTDPEEVNMCQKDQEGFYLSNFLCMHYPILDPKDIPEGYTACTWPANPTEKRKGRVTVTADAELYGAPAKEKTVAAR